MTACAASATGAAPRRGTRAAGFTLLELLVVLAIMAAATAGVGLALRDSSATRLEREAQRLAALLESARAQSRSTGLAVRWRAVEGGFRFEGLPRSGLPDRWLDDGIEVQGPGVLLLGPEPILPRQEVVLVSTQPPQRSLRVATDGLRPFTVSAEPLP
jgi:general secretion pathway protein H